MRGEPLQDWYWRCPDETLTASPPLIACGGLPCMIGVNRRSIQQTGSERPATKEYASDSDCHAVGPPRTRSRQNSADMNKPKPCKGNADSALFAASRPSSLPAASFSVSSTTGQCWFMSIRRSLLRVRLKAQGSRQQQTRPRPTSSKNMRHFSKAQFCRGLSHTIDTESLRHQKSIPLMAGARRRRLVQHVHHHQCFLLRVGKHNSCAYGHATE